MVEFGRKTVIDLLVFHHADYCPSTKLNLWPTSFSSFFVLQSVFIWLLLLSQIGAADARNVNHSGIGQTPQPIMIFVTTLTVTKMCAVDVDMLNVLVWQTTISLKIERNSKRFVPVLYTEWRALRKQNLNKSPEHKRRVLFTLIFPSNPPTLSQSGSEKWKRSPLTLTNKRTYCTIRAVCSFTLVEFGRKTGNQSYHLNHQVWCFV